MKIAETSFGRIVYEIDSRAGGKSDDLVLMSVSLSRGLIPRSELTDKEPRADDLSIYKRCWRGDVVLNRMSAYQGALGLAHMDGMVSPDYAVLRPHAGLDARFLTYLMKSNWFISEMTSRLRGIGSPGATSVRTPRVNIDDLRDISIALPPEEEQRRIADFLDDQVTRIDEVSQARKRQVDIAHERHLSEWDSSVRALNARERVVSLRRGLSTITDGPFGSSLTSAHYSDSGTRVVRLGNIGRNTFRDDDQVFIPNAYASQLSQHAVEPGDLLIAGLGDSAHPLGRSAVAPTWLGPAIVKADCYRARLVPGLEPEYVAWYLSAPLTAAAIALLSRGSTRSRLNTDVVRDAPLVIPNQATQESTVREWRQSDDNLQNQKKLLEESVYLLEERKRALITAAVTGQLDVTSVRPIRDTDLMPNTDLGSHEGMQSSIGGNR